jgi:hypothetical protein
MLALRGIAVRLGRRCYADAAAAAASLWHCYAAAALLCGCGCGCGCSVAVWLRCVVVVREVHEIALGQMDPGRTKLPAAAILDVDSIKVVLFTL